MGTPYQMRIEQNVILVTIDGKMTMNDGETLFATVIDEARQKGCRGLVYDARQMKGFDSGVIDKAKPSAKALGELGVRIAVVTDKTSVRLALTAVQLFAKQKIPAVATVEQALAFVRG
jgi:hypothetical protein